MNKVMRMRTRSILKAWPLIIPSLIFLSLFFMPVLISIDNSFYVSGNFVGFDSYIMTFNDPKFIRAFWYTLNITIVVLAVTLTSAIILALAIRKSFIGKKLTIFMLQFDVAVPALTCASMMLIALSQTGFLSSICYHLGLISNYDDFINPLNNSNGAGVMIAIIWMFVPYIALSLLAILHSMSNEQEEQAAALGVSKFRRLWHITLPSIKPAIAYTSILCFASVFASYELPSLIGKEETLVTLANYYFSLSARMPEYTEAYTIAIITTVITLAVSSVLMYYSLTAEERKK